MRLAAIQRASPIKPHREGSQRQSSLSAADLRLGRRILRLQLLDHVINDSPAPDRNSYFSFKEGGVELKRLYPRPRHLGLCSFFRPSVLMCLSSRHKICTNWALNLSCLNVCRHPALNCTAG
jgi:hypothetical protein